MTESHDRKSVVKKEQKEALGVHLRPELESGLEGAQGLRVWLPSRGPELGSQHWCQAAHNHHKYGPRESDPLLWPPRGHAHM